MNFRMNALRIGWLKPAEGFRLKAGLRRSPQTST
jgi:hypothetical protein